MNMFKLNKKILRFATIPVLVLALFVGIAETTLMQTYAQQKTTLEQRIKLYKAGLKRKVGESEKERMRLRCSVAQANVSALAKRVQVIKSKRITAYGAMSKELHKILKNLDAQAFETSQLKANITTYDGKVADFTTNITTYSQSLDDIVAMDCEKDPEAFIAALKIARKSHDAIVPLVTDIRVYVTNTIKPTLVQIRSQIASGQTTGGSQ